MIGGVDLTVHLQSAFHGALAVTALSGFVSVVANAAAPSTTIVARAGDINVQNAGNDLTIEGGISNITLLAAATLTGHSIRTEIW